MVSDINNISTPQPGKPRGNVSDSADIKPNNAQANTANAKQNNDNADTVELSSQATELSRLQQELQALPEVDNAKVEAIRERIENGSYVVDPEQLAAQILVNERDF